MSNRRGGRKIRIKVEEYAYPHSNSAKANGTGQVFPIIETGTKQHPYIRPANAIEELVEKLFDSNLSDDVQVAGAVFKYRMKRINKNLTGERKAKI